MRASSTFRALALAAVVLTAAADNHGQLSQPSLKTQDGHVLLSSGGVVSNLTDTVSATKILSVRQRLYITVFSSYRDRRSYS